MFSRITILYDYSYTVILTEKEKKSGIKFFFYNNKKITLTKAKHSSYN